MNRIELLNRRYESIVRLAQCKSGGVEINIVADPVGAHFDRCLRRLMSEAGAVSYTHLTLPTNREV